MFLEAEWVEREKWAIETKSIWHISTSSGIQLFKILFTGKNLFYDTFPIALVGFVKLILTIFQKKTEKFWPFFSFFSFFLGGVRKEANLYFGKIFFQWACRIILGPPKHVLQMVPSPNAFAKAFNVMWCIGPSAPLISDFGLFWANVNWYNRSKYKDFWMGPSLKFVSRLNGSFSTNKIIFFIGIFG